MRPEAAHYVNVIASESVDEAVRTVLLSELGSHDGVDSVAVSGVSPFDAGAPDFERLNSAAVEDLERNAAGAGGGWEKVATAAQTDSVLIGEVTAVLHGEIRVTIEGAVGLLRDAKGEKPPEIGDKLRVRVIMLNLNRRVLEVMRAR